MLPNDYVMDPSDSQMGSADAEKSGRQNVVVIRNVVLVIATFVSLIGLYYLSRYSFLLFHNIVEVFSIVIALAIFVIAWNTRKINDNNFFLFIGIAFVFVAILDLFHTLAYKGMGVFPGYVESNLATQLWIATRYVLSFTFLLPLIFINRKIRPTLIFAGYVMATGLLLFSIFFWQIFPISYDVNAQSLTTFKVASEYAISFIILVAIVRLVTKRNDFSRNIFKLLFAAMVLAVATEMSFTLYTDVYGIVNIFGHILNVLSFYLIYRALVQTNLNQPYETLFRNLKRSEINLSKQAEELTKVNQRLKEEVSQREGTEAVLRESEKRLQLKLDSVLLPDVELAEQDLKNIIDTTSLQAMMDKLYLVTKKGFALTDLKGNVLVATGWQDICTKFHRVNPETCRNCVESDLELSNSLSQGEIRLYKCKNNMWDIVTPLFLGKKHVGNVFFGQFFFDDEEPDRVLFATQAEKYGFDKKAYLEAFDRVPRCSRNDMKSLMIFYSQLSEIISKLSHGNLTLAKSLCAQKELQTKLEEKAGEIEEYASRMEELAEDRAKQLKDTERLSAIGATAGMVGHDIRNPLQAITSELYLERLEIDDLPGGEAKDSLLGSIRSIEENLFYINKIVADLQDFAKPLNPKKEEVNIKKIIEDALAMIQLPSTIKLKVSTKEDLPPLIADSTMIKRVLINLVQNAVQAMPNGGDLKINAANIGHKIEISVEDTGEGISKEVQAKLFTPLMTTKAKGQGFGLAVVKRMTEAMDGNIVFETQIGKGTIFTLFFSE